MIITVNKKKTQNILNNAFQNIQVVTTAQAVDQLNRFH